MNEDEKIDQENKRARQRKMVKERRIRAVNYNQELQNSIDDYRQKNELLRKGIESMTSELFSLMNVKSNQNVTQGIPQFYSYTNDPVHHNNDSLFQVGNDMLQNIQPNDSKQLSNNGRSINTTVTSECDDADKS